MGSGGGGGTTTIRYADYIEAHHKVFLDLVSSEVNLAIANNPFAGFDEVPVDVGFFGAGYSLASFPSLYDMYGKFMAGLDIEALWRELYEDTLNGPETQNLVKAESAFLQDQLDTEVLPAYYTGMRDMNAVVSSAFVVGKGLLFDSKNKSVAKFSAELKYKLIPIAEDRWRTHLAWNSDVIRTYEDVMKHFFTIKQGIDDHNYTYKEKYATWPLDVLEYERAALGALQGAITQKKSTSKGQGILSGALAGAAAGGMFGGVGALIGAVGGGLLGAMD